MTGVFTLTVAVSVAEKTAVALAVLAAVLGCGHRLSARRRRITEVHRHPKRPRRVNCEVGARAVPDVLRRFEEEQARIKTDEGDSKVGHVQRAKQPERMALTFSNSGHARAGWAVAGHFAHASVGVAGGPEAVGRGARRVVQRVSVAAARGPRRAPQPVRAQWLGGARVPRVGLTAATAVCTGASAVAATMTASVAAVIIIIIIIIVVVVVVVVVVAFQAAAAAEALPFVWRMPVGRSVVVAASVERDLHVVRRALEQVHLGQKKRREQRQMLKAGL